MSRKLAERAHARSGTAPIRRRRSRSAFSDGQALPRLIGWLTTDQRVHADQNDTVRLDELFQTRIRQLCTELE
jgi:hypothetical protein